MSFLVDETVLNDTDLSQSSSFTIHSLLRSYDVFWGMATDPCEVINQQLAQQSKNLLYIDEKVYGLYGKNIKHPVNRILQVKADETSKSLNSVSALYEFLYQNEFNKQDTLIVVGGGIVQDIAGFVCGTYKRGIRWVHFPTTLLSMSDSCIGGKAGVNYQGTKNQLAIFSPAHAVKIHPLFLNTLDERDIRSGFGEILKCALIGGRDYLNAYQQHALTQDMIPLIANALAVKKAVIEADEFEKNVRKVLNYGHTLGHVIESLSAYAIAHGLAVVIGIMLINRMCVMQGDLDITLCEEIDTLCMALLDDNTLAILKKIDIDEVRTVLKEDKKAVDDGIIFVTLSQLGRMHFVTYPLNDQLFAQIKTAFSYLFFN